MVRRWAAYAVVSGLVTACGSASPSPVADDPGPSPSRTSGVSSTVRPLDDFPLARGYGLTNGDDGSLVEVTGRSGVDVLVLCHEGVWSSAAPIAPVDLIGARWVRKVGDHGGITLVRYDGVDAASRVIDYVRRGVEVCPADGDLGTLNRGTDRDAGDDAFTLTQRIDRADTSTRLVVTDLVRVGDLLLLNTWSREDVSDGVIRLARLAVTVESDDLVPEMCAYATGGCPDRAPVPQVRIGPDGVGDVHLGMSEQEVAAAGMVIEHRQDGTGCSGAVLDKGEYRIEADIRPGAGIVTMAVSGADVVTPEGVGTDSLAERVLDRYPHADEGDGSLISAAVPGRPGAAYWFWITGGGVVSGVMLMLPGDRCYG